MLDQNNDTRSAAYRAAAVYSDGSMNATCALEKLKFGLQCALLNANADISAHALANVSKFLDTSQAGDLRHSFTRALASEQPELFSAIADANLNANLLLDRVSMHVTTNL